MKNWNNAREVIAPATGSSNVRKPLEGLKRLVSGGRRFQYLHYQKTPMRFQTVLIDCIDDSTEFEYVGFWLRLWASVLDSLLLMAILVPLVLTVFGWNHFITAIHLGGTADFLVSWFLPAVLILAIWTAGNRTPGKRAISAVVLDERTSSPPSLQQHIGRYLGYFLAVIPLGLGLVWVAFDPKKQGWHDKLAGTIVVRTRKKQLPRHADT